MGVTMPHCGVTMPGRTGQDWAGKKRRKKKENKKQLVFQIKYTHKEQRRRILTMSFKKLTKIQSPELILNKSVLINNMLKHIQSQILLEAEQVKHESASIDETTISSDFENNFSSC